MNDAPVIKLKDVTKTYQSGALAVQVLHGVSLEIHRGEFVAIMGQSGSGKSTLMNIIGCLDRPTSGSYQFDGTEVASLDREELAGLRRNAFGFVFQQYNLIGGADAIENVEMPAIYAGLSKAQRDERAKKLLTDLGLGDRMDHRPSQLSGGQQQRVSIARALMNGGTVILADEPTGALDSRSGREVMALLKNLNAQGHTVVLITHDPEVAKQANRVITISDGLITQDQGDSEIAANAMAVPDLNAGKSQSLNDVVEAAKMALRSLKANMFRTALTLLGIVIGVASVVAMLAIGEGSREQVVSSIQSMGTNLLLIRPGAPNVRGAGTVATLVTADAEELAKLPNVKLAVPEYSGTKTMRYGNRDYQTNLTATSPDYPNARDWDVTRGVFFSDEDVRSYAPVTVLGQTAANALFAGIDPIGKYVLVGNVPFQVIGVMASKGANAFGSDMDDVAFVPVTTGQLRLFGVRYLRNITVEVEDVSLIDATQKAVEDLLTARHRTVDFQVRNTESLLEMVSSTQDTMTMMLGSIAAISLLVGGIGVMNIMLVSVTERTREIGVRMAVGARPNDIMLQFLTEAVVVCAFGGVLGVGLGILVAYGVEMTGSMIVLSPAPSILAFGSSFLVGLVFGFMPARKAAGLDPVVALSTE